MDLFKEPDWDEAKVREEIALRLSTYKDKHGNKITFIMAGKLFEDLNYRRIGYSRKFLGYVSTVWIPFSLDGHQFETLLSWGHWNEMVMRYGTLEEAKEGHEAWTRLYWQYVLKENWIGHQINYVKGEWRRKVYGIANSARTAGFWQKYVRKTIRSRQ